MYHCTEGCEFDCCRRCFIDTQGGVPAQAADDGVAEPDSAPPGASLDMMCGTPSAAAAEHAEGQSAEASQPPPAAEEVD